MRFITERFDNFSQLKYQVRNITRYRNSFITRQNKQFEKNKELFHYFFSSELTDEERWDFIEDYFLGKDNIKDTENEQAYQCIGIATLANGTVTSLHLRNTSSDKNMMSDALDAASKKLKGNEARDPGAFKQAIGNISYKTTTILSST